MKLSQSVFGPIINAAYRDVAITTINKVQKSKNESDQYSWACEDAPEFWIKNHQEHHMKLSRSVFGPIINSTYRDIVMTKINMLKKSKNESDQYSWTCEAAPEFWIRNHQEHLKNLPQSGFGPITKRAYHDVDMTTIYKLQKLKNKSDQYIWACEPDPEFLMEKHQEQLKNLPQSGFGPITNRAYHHVAMTTINKIQKLKHKSDKYSWICEPAPEL